MYYLTYKNQYNFSYIFLYANHINDQLIFFNNDKNIQTMHN